MAESIILSDGTTNYEFVYNAASQADFKVHYGLKVEAGDPDALWHRPDNAPPQLIRLNNQTRTVFLTKDVYGNDWDDIMNTLAPIKRWVDGEDQQAARYHTEGDVDKIYLRIQLDGMTNYTDATVIYGSVDDSGSYYKPTDILNKRATGVVVMLVVEPLGTGAAITLRNDLASSPHFLEDSNADGLADGWSTTASAPATSIVTANYLTGGKAQQLITNNSSAQGIISPTATCTTSDPVVGYVWLKNPGQDPTSVQLLDGSNNQVTEKVLLAGDSTAVSDKSVIGAGGGTWYRVVVSDDGSPARTAANAKLRIIRTSGNATQITNITMDNAYLYVGSTTAPDAWCSTSAIRNRYDPTSSNEERINYLDTWGIPGDSDAIVDIASTVNTAASNPYRIHYGRINDGTFLAANRLYWFDTLTTAGVLNGSWSTPSDSSRSGGSYIRFTSTGSGSGNFSVSFTNDTGLRTFLNWPTRIFAISRTSNTGSGIGASSITGGSTIVDSLLGYTLANAWEWIDLGMINPNDAPLAYANTGGTPTMSFGVSTSTSSVTVDVDAIVLIPITEDGWLVGEGTSLTATDILYSLGSVGQLFFDNTASKNPFQGSLWTCKPGNIMNRYVFAISGVNNAHALTNAWTNTLTIYPRTRHLLGTK